LFSACKQVTLYENSALRVHLPDDSTFLREIKHGRRLENMTSYKKIRLRQSMRIYYVINPVEFHPNPTLNDGALSYVFNSVLPT